MARKYYRGPKKKSDTLGRLLIVMASRHQVWIPCDPETALRLRAEIQAVMERGSLKAMDLDAYIPCTIRVSAIEAVQYFPHKEK